MEGYLKSKSNYWKHAFKKKIRPGGKVSLNDLYNLYGKKYSIEEGDEFVSWLKDVKLKSTMDQWEIILQDEVTPKGISVTIEEPNKSDLEFMAEGIDAADTTETVEKVEDIKKESINDKSVEQDYIKPSEVIKGGDKNYRNFTVEDVVLLSVRKARELVPVITDKKLLRYALQEAGPRAGKENLCRILQKRITELDTISR